MNERSVSIIKNRGLNNSMYLVPHLTLKELEKVLNINEVINEWSLASGTSSLEEGSLGDGQKISKFSSVWSLSSNCPSCQQYGRPGSTTHWTQGMQSHWSGSISRVILSHKTKLDLLAINVSFCSRARLRTSGWRARCWRRWPTWWPCRTALSPALPTPPAPTGLGSLPSWTAAPRTTTKVSWSAD